MAKHTMNVSLTRELEEHVHLFIQKGLYGNQSEVVRAALRLLLEREAERDARLDALRRDIAVGVDDVEKGRGTVVTREQFRSKLRNKSDG